MKEIVQLLDREVLVIGNKIYSLGFFIVNLLLPLVLIMIISITLKKLNLNRFFTVKQDLTDDEKKKQKRNKSRFINLLSLIAALVVLIRLIAVLLSIESVLGIFSTPFISMGSLEISFSSLMILFFILYLANISSRFFSRLTRRYIKHYFNTRNVSTVGMFVRYSTLVLIIFIGLPFAGIDISSITFILGALGFGLGFGFQDSIANIIASITISTTHVISEGDRIIIEDIEGEVEKISMLNTVLRGIRGDELIIPNRYITEKPIHNFTHSDAFFYITGSVQVSYHSDLVLVEKIMVQAGQSLVQREKSKKILFRLQEFANSGILVSVIVCIKNAVDRHAALTDLNKNIWNLFQEHKIEIPFPQLDVYMKPTYTEKTRQDMT